MIKAINSHSENHFAPLIKRHRQTAVPHPLFMLKIEYLPINDIKPYKNNARKHQQEDVSAIVASIKEFGFDDPIGIWGDDNIIVEGHGRLQAAKELNMTEVPVIRLDHLSDEQRRAYGLAHNKTAELSEWDFDFLNLELDDITDIDMSQFGFDDDEDDICIPERKALTDRFVVPPFSVLDARQGYWNDRKREWLDFGIKSTEGRDAKAFTTEHIAEQYGMKSKSGTSIFDPVLTEVAYKWFCTVGGGRYTTHSLAALYGAL